MLTEAIVVTAGPLERAKAGCGEAFAEIVREHEAMVFSLGFHFFNDRSRAQEIAQEVFLQLYRSLDRMQSPSHVTHWLRQVTTRRCIDQVRGTKLRAVSLDDAGDLPIQDKTADPFLSRRLRKMIAGLPELQRMVVTLRYQEDLDPAEICKMVNLPVNTVKSHLHRALVSLRRKLGEI